MHELTTHVCSEGSSGTNMLGVEYFHVHMWGRVDGVLADMDFDGAQLVVRPVDLSLGVH